MPLPTPTRVPFVSVKMDNSLASQGPSILPYRVLMIGGKTSGGSAAQLQMKRVTSEAQARAYFGEGSQLHLMARAFLLNNRYVPLSCLALDDHASGVAATKTLTVTGPATAAGTMALYIGGKRITCAVSAGEAQNAIATALKAAIDATPDLPMVTSISTNVVTLTARNDGEEGSAIDVRFNFGEGEAFPAGVSVAVATGVMGSQNPLIQNAIDVIGDDWFQVIVAPYGDATNLAAISAELTSRFDEVRQIPGQYIFAKQTANLAAMETFGQTQNSPHLRCIPFNGIPWSAVELAASWSALEAGSAQADPAKPQFRQTIQGLGARHPAPADQLTFEEQNNLLLSGVSVVGYGPGGTLQIGRAITMYRKNEANADDDSYLRAETMYTLMYFRYDFRNQFLKEFPRAKLADDGVRVRAGDSVITPSIAKAKAVAIARGWEGLTLLENIEQFKNDLVVERDSSDRDRLNFLAQPDTVNQLVLASATFQFKL